MDIFTGLSLGRSPLYFIPPMLLLPVVMIVCAVTYKILLGNISLTKIYKCLTWFLYLDYPNEHGIL